MIILPINPLIKVPTQNTISKIVMAVLHSDTHINTQPYEQTMATQAVSTWSHQYSFNTQFIISCSEGPASSVSGRILKAGALCSSTASIPLVQK